jgi:hypothetical protein
MLAQMIMLQASVQEVPGFGLNWDIAVIDVLAVFPFLTADGSVVSDLFKFVSC